MFYYFINENTNWTIGLLMFPCLKNTLIISHFILMAIDWIELRKPDFLSTVFSVNKRKLTGLLICFIDLFIGVKRLRHVFLPYKLPKQWRSIFGFMFFHNPAPFWYWLSSPWSLNCLLSLFSFYLKYQSLGVLKKDVPLDISNLNNNWIKKLIENCSLFLPVPTKIAMRF